MANNYLQFSFKVPMSEEAGRWCQSRLDCLGELAYGTEDAEDAALIEEVRGWELGKVLLDEQTSLGFSSEYEDGALYLWAEESGDVEHAALFVLEYLRKWEPTGIVGFEYSVSCSKPRVDEFGGGAVVITKNSYVVRSTASLLDALKSSGELMVVL